MKTAISVPDPLFEEADRYARARGKSRSQLYSEAMEEYLARRDPEGITEQMNRALDKANKDEENLHGFVQAAANQILRETEW